MNSPFGWLSAQVVHKLSCQVEPLSTSFIPAALQLLCSVQFWVAEAVVEKVPLGQVVQTVSWSTVPVGHTRAFVSEAE